MDPGTPLPPLLAQRAHSMFHMKHYRPDGRWGMIAAWPVSLPMTTLAQQAALSAKPCPLYVANAA